MVEKDFVSLYVLPVLQPIVNVGWEAYKALTTPDPEKERRKLAFQAVAELQKNSIERMEVNGGWMVNVTAAEPQYQGQLSNDILVSITYHAEARPQRYVEQHIAYSVDTSSWKVLENDLIVLGKHFIDANQRAHKRENLSVHNILQNYPLYIQIAHENAIKEKYSSGPQL